MQTSWGLKIMRRPKIPPMLMAGRCLRAAALGGALAAALTALPSAARADCDVPDNGVPEDTLPSSLGSAWASLGGLRPAFAKGGVAIGGNYFGEAFVNSGGIPQGGKYDGVLELYMDIEMHKLGLWKGLCFHTNG
jgi:porin